MDKIDKYLEHIYIQEDFQNLIETTFEKDIHKVSKDIKGKKIFKQMHSLLDPKNPAKSLKKIKKFIPKVPKININTIDKYMASKVKDYRNLKKTADVIISNSITGISKESKDAASSFLAISSLFGKKKEKITTKDNLKKNIRTFVTKVRKFTEEYEEKEEGGVKISKEDIPDFAVAWVIVIMTISLAIAVGTGLYGIIATVSGLISGIGGGTFILAAFLLVAYLYYLGTTGSTG